ncbi:MAG: MutS-related protein [Candidatus Merdivicinus sp.]|jgi:hypothetical protein
MEYVLAVIGGILLIAGGFHLYDRSAGLRKLRERLERQYGLRPSQKGGVDFDSVEAYWEERRRAEPPAHWIDSLTWSDLDMDEVFERIDACQTSIGEEYLYSVLHEPLFDREALDRRESLIAFFQDHPEERLDVQTFLARMGKSNYSGLANFLYHPEVREIRGGELFSILPFLPLFCLLFMVVNPAAGLIGAMLSIPVNMAVYYLFKRKVEHELAAVRYISAMLCCCRRLIRWKSPALPELREQLKEDFVYFQSFRGLGQMGRVGASEVDFLADYMNMLLFADLRGYRRLLSAVKKHRAAFHRLYRFIGELDLAICTASFRESLPVFCAPEFTEENALTFRSLAHPLLRDPVTNSGILHSAVVTGSNASGKSTFVKALAVNGILAQTLHTCSAAAFSTRPALVITSMAVRDSLSAGDSYFVTEIKSLRRILRQAAGETYCVCYVDEILKGTNTIERIAASASVLSCLRRMDCLCVTASHDVELTDLMEGLYENWHFCETITPGGVEFDYKLKAGPSRTRNAIQLLGRMDFPAEITGGAEWMVERFASTGLWELPPETGTEKDGE